MLPKKSEQISNPTLSGSIWKTFSGYPPFEGGDSECWSGSGKNFSEQL